VLSGRLTPIISRPGHRRRNKKEKRLFGVGWMNLLTHQFIVFFMAADPKPKQSVGNLNSNSALMNSDTDRPITANFLQM